MILYHGSSLEIKNPDIMHSRKEVDFGRGFYTTPLFEQARKWSERFKRSGKSAIVNRYSFDEKAFQQCNVLRFDTYSEEWLDFIVKCRQGDDQSDYEIVMGGVANDRVFNTVELFCDHLIEKDEAIKRLRFEKPNLQIAFRSQEVLDRYILFEGSREL